MKFVLAFGKEWRQLSKQLGCTAGEVKVRYFELEKARDLEELYRELNQMEEYLAALSTELGFLKGNLSSLIMCL
jgi:hypothetical protein